MFWASQVALVVKNPPANAEDTRDAGLIPGSGRSPGEGNGNPLQYSRLENSMDRGTWRATVLGSQRVGHNWVTNILGQSASLPLPNGKTPAGDQRKPVCSPGHIWKLLEEIVQRRQWHPIFQYFCLENPMDGGAWKAAVHGVAKSRTQLSDFTFTFHFHALEKEMATHSSVLAWRIPGTGEPGGLPSLGLHRVGHDWSDLAAAAAACCSP